MQHGPRYHNTSLIWQLFGCQLRQAGMAGSYRALSIACIPCTAVHCLAWIIPGFLTDRLRQLVCNCYGRPAELSGVQESWTDRVAYRPPTIMMHISWICLHDQIHAPVLQERAIKHGTCAMETSSVMSDQWARCNASVRKCLTLVFC